MNEPQTSSGSYSNKELILYSIIAFLSLIIVILSFICYGLYSSRNSTSEGSLDGSAQQAITDNSDVVPTIFINYTPVGFRYNDFQKVGQTFVLDSDLVINGVFLKGSYGVGNLGYLTIYETSDPIEADITNRVAMGSFVPEEIIQGEEFLVNLTKPVYLQRGIRYLFIVEVLDEKFEANVGFAEADIYKEGKKYLFSRAVGGNGDILSDDYQWQPRNSEDLIFSFDINN